jgi:hypothetical protein
VVRRQHRKPSRNPEGAHIFFLAQDLVEIITPKLNSCEWTMGAQVMEPGDLDIVEVLLQPVVYLRAQPFGLNRSSTSAHPQQRKRNQKQGPGQHNSEPYASTLMLDDVCH